MHWDFFTSTVQQTETTMWQFTGKTSNQVISVFAQITNIIIMHQFPVHTEHTKISHSLHTTVTIMYSSNGCSTKLLVLQKRSLTQFDPAFPFIFITSINVNLSKNHSPIKTVSTPHNSTSRQCCVTVCLLARLRLQLLLPRRKHGSLSRNIQENQKPRCFIHWGSSTIIFDSSLFI